MSELNFRGWPLPEVNNQQTIVDGRFQLVSTLGVGAVGEVYLALDLAHNPPARVALKRLHAELLQDQEAVQQLYREAQLTYSLNHPNILKVYYAQFRQDTAYIVIELAKQPLSHINLPLPLDIVADYLERLAAALDYAHSQGLIHRDIKPENVLIDEKGKVLLADFSLSLAVDRNCPAHVMQPIEAWGTPIYAAPEVWNGQICKASDTYALGILIFQMVCGRTPFEGSPEELEQQHLHSPVPPISNFILANYPAALNGVFERVLAKDPTDRPASNLEFYRLFQAALRTRFVKEESELDVYELYPRSDPNFYTSNSKRSRLSLPQFFLYFFVALPFAWFMSPLIRSGWVIPVGFLIMVLLIIIVGRNNHKP